MKRDFIVRLVLYIFLITFFCPKSYGFYQGPVKQPEYHVKLVFIFNFMKFCTWPENKRYGDWVIGVLGDDPFESQESWRILKGRTLKGRTITRVKFKSGEDSYGDMRKCHVLFVGNMPAGELKNLGKKLRGNGVLIITDNGNIDLPGGMINFVNTSKRGSQKITFEVNLSNMNGENIRIRLSVLKLASKVSGGNVEFN